MEVLVWIELMDLNAFAKRASKAADARKTSMNAAALLVWMELLAKIMSTVLSALVWWVAHYKFFCCCNLLGGILFEFQLTKLKNQACFANGEETVLLDY